MAITFEKPLKEWYYEQSSVWTLDYPPFFAYFEWLLGQIGGNFVDREMVKVENQYYGEISVTYYQRATVIVSDLVYLWGVLRYYQADAALKRLRKIDIMKVAFVYCSSAFLILDNIHFQYNSMMYGLLLLSLAYIK
jgi:alpha-1,3-glucosyltransferase